MELEIERVLDQSYIITAYGVEFMDESNTYKIIFDIVPPSDVTDLSELVTLKNKLRAKVKRPYKLQFVIGFTC